MNKSQTPLPLTPSQVSEMHNHIVDDSFYGLSVSVCGGGGAGAILKFSLFRGGFHMFFFRTEKGFRF